LSLKPIQADRLIKILVKVGFTPLRQKGSHVILRNMDGRLIVVPVHRGEKIGIGLLLKIVKESGLTRERFLELLNST
jgi:predicted RNA binding protein YcfA (HicA-like mRNA interferase family)